MIQKNLKVGLIFSYHHVKFTTQLWYFTLCLRTCPSLSKPSCQRWVPLICESAEDRMKAGSAPCGRPHMVHIRAGTGPLNSAPCAPEWLSLLTDRFWIHICWNPESVTWPLWYWLIYWALAPVVNVFSDGEARLCKRIVSIRWQADSTTNATPFPHIILAYEGYALYPPPSAAWTYATRPP